MIGNHEQVVGAGVLKLGHVAFVTPEPQALAKFYGEGAGLSRLGLDRRLLCVHALQRRPPFGELHPRQSAKMHHIAYELRGFLAPANRVRSVRRAENPIIWGRCGSARPQRRRLPPRP
jgi:hypothetical protein